MAPEADLLLTSQLSVCLYVFLTVCISEAGQVQVMVPEDYLVLSSQLSVFLYVCLHMIMFLTVCLSEAGQVHHAQG